MPVNAVHKDYDKMVLKWKLVRAIVNNEAQDFIREVDPNDQLRTKQYKTDAILTNFTRLTKVGLVGLVFKSSPEFTLPKQLKYLEEDTTGGNLGLDQFAQFCLSEVLETGRLGLLAELPNNIEGYTDGDEQKVSRIKPYTAESIINWRFRTIGNEIKPCLIVLKELIEEQKDESDRFDWEIVPQYRVLELNNENMYTQCVYDQFFNLIAGSEIIPLDYTGKPFDEIPFVFLGSENNDPGIDPIPLYDLAHLNLGHYRNSADYEESVFITGQPTVFLGMDLSNDEFKLLYPNGIVFGSRAGFNIGPNGSVHLVQANPNQLAAEAMKDKLAQAAAIGARLISPAGGRETAEAAKIRYGAQNSALYNVTHNVEQGLDLILHYNARFMLEDAFGAEIEVKLNDQFYEDAADPNLIAQEILLMQQGIIAPSDIRNYLRDVGVLPEDRTDEDIEKDVKAYGSDQQPSTDLVGETMPTPPNAVTDTVAGVTINSNPEGVE